ncbi:MAG: ribosome maturation factor RimP [Cyclobacteriaceae bacterium]
MITQQPIEAEIEQFVSEIISESEELFIVKVILKGHVGNQKLIVLLDGDNGVTIEQCSKVSRSLADILEEKDIFSEKYMLEVSSAGLDFPLQNLRQYKKNIGRNLKIDLVDGSSIKGELIEVREEHVVLKETLKKETKEHKINIKEINKSMVLVSFK